MTETYILQLIPQRIKELGYHNYRIRHRDITIRPQAEESIAAFNELWFIVDDPPGLLIESYYGIYDSTGEYLFDNAHQHRGEIIIVNPDSEFKRIKFIQVIILN